MFEAMAQPRKCLHKEFISTFDEKSKFLTPYAHANEHPLSKEESQPGPLTTRGGGGGGGVTTQIHSTANTVSSLCTIVFTTVHRILEHPNQEGNTCDYARTTRLMAESVYGVDIQSIVTDH